MTEEEWLAETKPENLLHYAAEQPERKSRLFACFSCRLVSGLLVDERSRQAIEVAERYAEGLVEREALSEARRMAREATRNVAGLSYPSSFERAIAKASAEATSELVGKSVGKVLGSIVTRVLIASSEAAGLEGGRQGAYPEFRCNKLREDSNIILVPCSD